MDSESEYRQSMAAVACVYPSGWVDLVSLHRHVEDAVAERDRLKRLIETGESAQWSDGELVVASAECDVFGTINRKKLLGLLRVDGEGK